MFRLSNFAPLAFAALGLLNAPYAMAQSAAETCIPISGGIDLTLLSAEPAMGLGVVSGTLAGSSMGVVGTAEPQEDGTIRIPVTHHFVTDDRSSLTTDDEVIWTPVPGREGVFHMVTTYNIVSGSRRFANASGSYYNHGEADTNRGLVTLTYGGEICGVSG